MLTHIFPVILLACCITCEPCKRNPGGIGTRDFNAENGTVAGIGEYPWAVAIEIKGEIQCAGALILPQVVISAAHCSSKINLSDAYILAGVWNVSDKLSENVLQKMTLRDIKLAPEFQMDDGGIGNDIAVLLLSAPVVLTEYVNTICLKNTTILNEPCFATGWGATEFGGNKTKVPKNLTLPIVDHDTCQDLFRNSDLLDENFKLSDKQMCAGGMLQSDTCQGDGGAPLVCPVDTDDDRYILAAVTSWGIGCNSELPGVYTQISHHLEWINEIVEAEGYDTATYLIE